MSQPHGGQPPPPLLPADRPRGASSLPSQSPQVDTAEQRLLGSVTAHTSAALLSRMDLPLAPVVVPQVGSPRDAASSPRDGAEAQAGPAADGAHPASPRSPLAPSLSPLRTHSSRLFSAAALHRAGTEVRKHQLAVSRWSRPALLLWTGAPHIAFSDKAAADVKTMLTTLNRRCRAAAGCHSLPAPARLLPPAAPPACCAPLPPRCGHLGGAIAASWGWAGRRMRTRRSWWRGCRAGTWWMWPPAPCTPPR